jgi:hypothetical protein
MFFAYVAAAVKSALTGKKAKHARNRAFDRPEGIGQ